MTWKAQLKIGSKTFTKPKVKLNVDDTPDIDCCEEALKKIMETCYSMDSDVDLDDARELPQLSCDKLFMAISFYLTDDYIPISGTYTKLNKILDEWSVCEGWASEPKWGNAEWAELAQFWKRTLDFWREHKNTKG